MSNALMIPESGIPAHILALGTAAVAADNDDAMAGVSAGMPPRIKLNGTKFALIDTDGTETPYPASKLVIGPDENQYLPVVVLKAKPSMTKQFYLKKYSKDDEPAVPDCFSSDGVRPDVGVIAPISETCATCPKNAFGSGIDLDGNPSKGKACSDTKIIAVLVPGFGVYSLRIPPASLKGWGGFVKKLTSSNIPVTAIKTYVGFDPSESFPVLVFQFGGFVDEKALPKLQAMAASPEVIEIVGGGAAPKALPAAPKQEVKDDIIEPEPEVKEPPKKAKGKAKPAPAPIDDDLGLDTEAAEETLPPSEEITDDDLANELGL